MAENDSELSNIFCQYMDAPGLKGITVENPAGKLHDEQFYRRPVAETPRLNRFFPIGTAFYRSAQFFQ